MSGPGLFSRLGAVAAAIILALGLSGREASAQQLVADLSSHLVEITTDFTGVDVLLFGAIEGAGDVVVVVRGPSRDEIVRRKGRVGAIWLNTEEARFTDVPIFYGLASSAPVTGILGDSARARHGIGLDKLVLSHDGPLAAEEAQAFRQGLIRARIENGLYSPETTPVTFLGPRLFRATLSLPGNVPVGSYNVQVFLVRDGVIVSAQTTPLLVAKAGLSADIYHFAHASPMLYGIMAILLALFAGWAAGAIFRKG